MLWTNEWHGYPKDVNELNEFYNFPVRGPGGILQFSSPWTRWYSYPKDTWLLTYYFLATNSHSRICDHIGAVVIEHAAMFVLWSQAIQCVATRIVLFTRNIVLIMTYSAMYICPWDWNIISHNTASWCYNARVFCTFLKIGYNIDPCAMIPAGAIVQQSPSWSLPAQFQ
jgi:hypothetical protein